MPPPAFSWGRARRLRCRLPTTYRLSARTSARIACTPFSTRQNAAAFNQPLSFDTSSVTDMEFMFFVRSAPAPSLHSQALPCVPPPPSPHTSFRLPSPHLALLSHALLSTRQYASAFNQPLSFNTSKVTDMFGMFSVRSAHAL